jgi:hypothetical protein
MATGVEWIVNLQTPLVNNRRSTDQQSITNVLHTNAIYQLYYMSWGSTYTSGIMKLIVVKSHLSILYLNVISTYYQSWGHQIYNFCKGLPVLSKYLFNFNIDNTEDIIYMFNTYTLYTNFSPALNTKPLDYPEEHGIYNFGRGFPVPHHNAFIFFLHMCGSKEEDFGEL